MVIIVDAVFAGLPAWGSEPWRGQTPSPRSRPRTTVFGQGDGHRAPTIRATDRAQGEMLALVGGSGTGKTDAAAPHAGPDCGLRAAASRC